MSSVVRTLEVILEALDLSSQVKVISFRDDGASLWLNNQAIVTEQTECVVVVWDGGFKTREPTFARLGMHLTPLDWALAFSLRALPKKQSYPVTIPRLLIMDLASFAWADSYAVRTMPSFLDALPWLTVLSCVGCEFYTKNDRGERIRLEHTAAASPEPDYRILPDHKKWPIVGE